jgi:hypothetical protein
MKREIPIDDDDQPYAVTGEEERKPCLHCKKSLPRDALLCNHCGYHQQTGETLQRAFERVDKEWETGLRFQLRFNLFLAIAGAAAAAAVVVAVVDGFSLALVVTWLVGTLLWVFVIGTYPRINLTRTTAGHVRLTKTWRCCLVPLSTAEVRWRGCSGISVAPSGPADLWDWVALVLLVLWGLIPGLIWWYCVMRSDQLDVALTKEHGATEVLLYRGRDDAMAREIADTLRSVTGLRQ